MQSGGEWAKYASFGYTRRETRSSGVHQGLDLFALDDNNTRVYACLSGKIYSATTSGSYGKVIILEVSDAKQLEILKNRKREYSLPYKGNGEIEKGNNFTDTGKIYFRYAHLQSFLVKADDEVAAGMPIAISGTIGIPNGGTCGPHVHFEIASSTSTIKGDALSYRVNPGYYVYYKRKKLNEKDNINANELLSNEEINIQSQRVKLGKR